VEQILKSLPLNQVPAFDEEKHVYYIDDKKVPGVNEILKKVGITREYAGVDSFYRERGIAAHKAIEYLTNGELDEHSLDPILKPYVDGFKGWWSDELQSAPRISEPRLYSKKYGFCGTIDLIVGEQIIDYKCSKDPDPASEIQGLFYQQLVYENYGQLFNFSILQFPGDGTHKVIPSTINGRFDILEAVIKIYEWRIKKHVRKM